MTLYCGVDGGGTRTRAVLADADGRLVGYGVSGASNPKSVGLDGMAASVREALDRAFMSAESRDGVQLFIGLAGVRTEADRNAVMDVLGGPLSEIGLGGAKITVGHDLDVALAAALGGKPGVVLVVGTGSAALGRDAAGRTRQAGGWGWYIDDPGSGYWLGYQAMRAAARSCDGRGPMTMLEERVRSFLRVRTLHEMPNIIYNPHFSRERVAELAPIVFEVADAGDICANEILKSGFEELALMVSTVARELELERPKVSAVGGITLSGASFKNRMVTALQAQLPFAELVHACVTPVVGSVILAMTSAGLVPGESVLQTLQESVVNTVAHSAAAS